MTSGCRNFERTLDVLLTLNIRKVKFIFVQLGIKLFTGIYNLPFEACITVKKPDNIQDVLRSVNFKLAYNGRFPCILLRQDKAFETLFACFYGNGQRPFDGL